MTESAAIDATALTKHYGPNRGVDALSFSVPTGSICGFIGPNGAGKTTTIRMLLGLIEPSAGTATVLGHPITDPSSYLRRVGAMIEGPAFYPTLSGRRNLEVLARLGQIRSQRVDDMLEQVDLAAAADRPFRSYSLGMKQRLGLAAALLGAPELLVLDEPTNGLDPPGIREVRDLLSAFAASGRTVLVSSHLLDELQQVCDHVVVIDEGSLRFQGPIDGLMAATTHKLVVRSEHSSDADALVAALRDNGAQAHLADGRIEIDVAADQAAWVNRTAMDHGITLVEIGAIEPRLEDVFFELTGVQR